MLHQSAQDRYDKPRGVTIVSTQTHTYEHASRCEDNQSDAEKTRTERETERQTEAQKDVQI